MAAMSDRKLAEKLVSAATSGDAEVLKRLLRSKDAKKAINSRPPPLGASPLVAAACCCRDKAVAILLAHGADPAVSFSCCALSLGSALPLTKQLQANPGWLHTATEEACAVHLAILTLHTATAKLLLQARHLASVQQAVEVGGADRRGSYIHRNALVVWLCNKVRVRCNAQKLESMLQLLHDRDPQTPFIYASCLWQLCMCGMLTTAQMLMRDPYMPPLTDPGSPVCASLLCSALASQPQPEDMLSATLAFFRQQFADAGAEQLWFKHLASHNGAGKTPLLVCVELRNADMCRAILDHNPSESSSAWTPYSTGPNRGLHPLEVAAANADLTTMHYIIIIARKHADRIQQHLGAVLKALFAASARPGEAELGYLFTVMLKLGVQLHEPLAGCGGRTALMLACLAGYEECVNLLTMPSVRLRALEASEVVKEQCPCTRSPYSCAEDLIDEMNNVQQWLCNEAAAKADLPDRAFMVWFTCGMSDVRHVMGWTYLWHGHKDLLHGKDAGGFTPLMLACQSGSLSLFKCLLQLAGDMQARMLLAVDNQGRNPLHHALLAAEANIDMIFCISSAADACRVGSQLYKQRDNCGHTFALALFELTHGDAMRARPPEQPHAGNIAKVLGVCRRELYNTCCHKGRSPLSNCVRAGWQRVIQELLSHGGSLQEVLTTLDMGDGLTPLGFAVAHDRRAIGLQLVQACRTERVSIGHALNGKNAKRLTSGIKHPLFLAVIRQHSSLEWLGEAADLTDDALQTVYVQKGRSERHMLLGFELTGSVLQCKADAPALQQKRPSFEALTLLMSAAACGNVRELVRLLAAGQLQKESRRTAGNVCFKNAMTMALKHSQIFSNDGRIKPRIQDDACAAEHLACIGQLLRAKCSLTSDQYTYLKSLLKARDDTLQPPAEQQEFIKVRKLIKAGKIAGCTSCGTIGLWSRCMKCEQTCYCSVECQRKDWAVHKRLCARKGKS